MSDKQIENVDRMLDVIQSKLRTSDVKWFEISAPKFFSEIYSDARDAGEALYMYTNSLKSKMIPHESGVMFLYPFPYYKVPRNYKGRRMYRWPSEWNGKPFPTLSVLELTAKIMLKNIEIREPSYLASFLVYETLKHYSRETVIDPDGIYYIIERVYGNDNFLKESNHGEFKINKRWFIENNVCIEDGTLNTAKAVEYARRVLHGDNNTDIAIIDLMSENSKISLRRIAEKTGVSLTTIAKHVKSLQKNGKIRREGSVKNGIWIVTEQQK